MSKKKDAPKYESGDLYIDKADGNEAFILLDDADRVGVRHPGDLRDLRRRPAHGSGGGRRPNKNQVPH